MNIVKLLTTVSFGWMLYVSHSHSLVKIETYTSEEVCEKVGQKLKSLSKAEFFSTAYFVCVPNNTEIYPGSTIEWMKENG